MKIRYSLLLLLSMFLGFAGCSDDDENTPIVEEEVSLLKLDNDSVVIQLDVKNVFDVNIVDGAGDYKVFSLNSDIAEVKVTDKTIQIEGLKFGTTSVIVMDANSSIKNIEVRNQYDKITMDREVLRFDHFYGTRSENEFFFLTGNGDYKVEVQDAKMLEAKGTKKSIILKNLVNDGKTSVKVTDALGKEINIPVEITSSIKPYTEKELEVIKNKKTPTFNWENSDLYTWGEYINTTVDGLNVLGHDYYGYALKVFFPGDKTVGERTGCKVEFQNWSGANYTRDLSYFEIVKNDGEYIWMVFSAVDDKEGTGVAGHMIYPLDR